MRWPGLLPLLLALLLGLSRECGAVMCWVGTADCFPQNVSVPATPNECAIPIDHKIGDDLSCFFDLAAKGAWTCPGRSLEECGGAADCGGSLYKMGTVTAEGVPTVKANHGDFKRCRRPIWPDGVDSWYVGNDFQTATGVETDCVEPIYGKLVDCAGACVLEVRVPQNSLYEKTPFWGFERVEHRYCALAEEECVPTNTVINETHAINGSFGATVNITVSAPQPLDYHLGHPETGFARHCCKEDFCNAAPAALGTVRGALLLSALAAVLLFVGSVR